MPGLAGFAASAPMAPRDLDMRLQGLEDAMSLSDQHRWERLLFGPQVGGAIAHPKWHTVPCTLQTDTGLAIWFDGAIFNRSELCQQRNWSFGSDAAFLLAALTKPEIRPVLKTIDGLFSAVVFDAHRSEIHLLSDRHGLRPLYWLQTNQGLVWASEAKAFLALPEWTPEITPGAPEIFLTTGQLPPDKTWLRGVEPVPPATRLTFRITTGVLTRERYWWWHEIAPLVGKAKRRELARELGARFKSAVARQIAGADPGLLLSGGLDSRAICAALPDSAPNFTFGEQSSDDVAIASRVAQIRKAPHTVYPLTAANWLTPRIQGVWWTDGALNLIHMHGIEHLDPMGQSAQIILNGAGGDGLAGGGHLFAQHQFSQYLKNKLGIELTHAPDAARALNEALNEAGSAHAFYVYWRMRGFTGYGPRLLLFGGMDFRLPFLDNAVQEWLFSIPIEHKQGNHLYREMLLGTFPEYFKTIPWQATGYPITWPQWAVRGRRLLGVRKSRPTGFAGYAVWLRAKPARFFIDALLLPTTARHRAYTDSAEDLWRRHLAGEDHSEQLGRYLTLELYLRQVFDGAPRTLEDALRAIPET